MFEILTYVALLNASTIFIYTFLKRKRLSNFISLKDIGVFERDLKNLKQVIVVASKVEKPSSTLAEAVEDNFIEGVKYLFLVSKSSAEKELNGYYLIFEALAKIASNKVDRKINVKELVEIKKLEYDWLDFPLIIYQFESGENAKARISIAFKGNQKGEGIADYYERLDPRHSESFINSLLANASNEIRRNLTLIENVVPFIKVKKS